MKASDPSLGLAILTVLAASACASVEPLDLGDPVEEAPPGAGGFAPGATGGATAGGAGRPGFGGATEDDGGAPVELPCPVEAPEDRTACALPDGTRCDYRRDDCRCRDGEWDCD